MKTPNKKKSSKNKKKVVKTGPDRLSALPDDMLHHILSFLDMKEVIKTSLLSSRWRYMWVSLPVINCDYSLWFNAESNETRFMNFVDKVLLLRDGSDIKKFQLCCSGDSDPDRVGTWITSAARRHPKEVKLLIFHGQQIELPRVLFSPDITALEVAFVDMDEGLNYTKIPNLICSMTRLTTLSLVFIELHGNSSGELSLNYPFLEELILTECIYEHIKVLEISSPQLKTLYIVRTEDSWNENFRIRNLSVLVSATIHFGYDDEKSMVKLLEDISCAKTIDLSFGTLGGKDYPSTVTTRAFSNLRCLKLSVDVISSSGIISFMLKNFPSIETLKLSIDFIDIDGYLKDMFACVNYNLKYVKIGGLRGDEDGYKCLETLLMNAYSLEKLVIRMNSFCCSSMEMKTFKKKILSLSRASSRVAISFH